MVSTELPSGKPPPHRAGGMPAASSPSVCGRKPSRSSLACTFRRDPDRQSARHLATRPRHAAAADAVIAEDTRVTKALLAHYGISTPLVAYHEHNADGGAPAPSGAPGRRRGAGAGLRRGHAACSDPGFKLVSEALAQGTQVASVAPAPPPCSPRWSSRGCRPIASSSRVFAAETGRPPHPHRRTAAIPARSSFSNRQGGSPKCWPTSPPPLVPARRQSRAN